MYPMYAWARALWNMPRSITGRGVRQTLGYLSKLLPGLAIIEVASGTKAFDWRVPEEWNIFDAYIADASGTRLIDWTTCNLHVVGYSTPINATMTREELEPHLYSLPDRPDAIPYITSYYRKRWGFCLSQKQRDSLGSGPFKVYIGSEMAPGSLTYGELLLPGQTDQEVLISTYICHPMMANDNLSGIVVTAALARWLQEQQQRRCTYRILFVPETIGSITYLALSRNCGTGETHLEHLRKKMIAGYVLTCCGDDRNWTFLPSLEEDTLANRAADYVLNHSDLGWRRLPFISRGSDERQYNMAGLPVALIMRSGFGRYGEYHTSQDDLTVISQKAMEETFNVYRRVLAVIDANQTWKTVQPCEPFLSQYNLYSDISLPSATVPDVLNVLTYCNGKNDLIKIANTTGIPFERVVSLIGDLAQHHLVQQI